MQAESTPQPDGNPSTTTPTPAISREQLRAVWERKRAEAGLPTIPPLGNPIGEAVARLRVHAAPERTPEEIAQQEAADLERKRAEVRRQRQSSLEHMLSRVGARYADASLETFNAKGDKQQAVLAKTREYADDMRNRLAAGSGVVLYGPPGTGKDHLMVGLMRVAILRGGVKVVWLNGLDFYGEVRNSIDSEDSDGWFIDRYGDATILAISDPVPPSGKLTEFQQSVMLRLIDHRYRNRLPTWVTVNIAKREEAIERMGAALFDRLCDGAMCLFCNWSSHRSPSR